MNAITQPPLAPSQKHRAFQMSANEVYLDLDEDDYPEGTNASRKLGGGEGKVDYCLGRNNASSNESILKTRSVAKVDLSASSMLIQSAAGAAADGPVVLEKRSSHVFSNEALPSMTFQQPLIGNCFASVPTGATESLTKHSEPDQDANTDSLSPGTVNSPETVGAAVSLSSPIGGTFGLINNCSTLKNGSLPSMPSVFSSSNALVTNNFGQNSSSSSSIAVAGTSTMSSTETATFSCNDAAATDQSSQPFISSDAQISTTATGLISTAVPSSSGNSDPMSMEDSMSKDVIQGFAPTVSMLNQQSVRLSSPSFIFWSTTPSGTNPFGATILPGANPTTPAGVDSFGGTLPSVVPPFGFTTPSGLSPYQFSSQSHTAIPQNPSLFQASSSLDSNAGGSFSLIPGGHKSNRRIVKPRKSLRKG